MNILAYANVYTVLLAVYVRILHIWGTCDIKRRKDKYLFNREAPLGAHNVTP